MTNENQILTLEEGITRSIPSVAISYALSKKVRDSGKYSREERSQIQDKIRKEMVFKYLTKNPGHYEVSRPERRDFLVSQGEENDYSVGFSPSLRVNLEDFTSIYKGLLENPSEIYKFVELLNPEIRNLFLEGIATKEDERHSRESLLIKNLFGIADHSRLKAVCNENDLLKVSNYIRDKIILPMFDIKNADDDVEAYAYLKGSPQFERIYGEEKVKFYYQDGTLKLAQVGSFINNLPDNIISFGSQFQLPVNDSVRGKQAFNGLTRMLDTLKQCPEINGIDLDIGILPCILPTWQRE